MHNNYYVKILCSTTPNNHCEICSYSPPQPTSITCYVQLNGTGVETCPSCGRMCRAVMHYVNLEPVTSDNLDVLKGGTEYRKLPKNGEHTLTTPFRSTKQLQLEMPPPTHPTIYWRDNYWEEWYENNPDKPVNDILPEHYHSRPVNLPKKKTTQPVQRKNKADNVQKAFLALFKD